MGIELLNYISLPMNTGFGLFQAKAYPWMENDDKPLDFGVPRCKEKGVKHEIPM